MTEDTIIEEITMKVTKEHLGEVLESIGCINNEFNQAILMEQGLTKSIQEDVCLYIHKILKDKLLEKLGDTFDYDNLQYITKPDSMLVYYPI